MFQFAKEKLVDGAYEYGDLTGIENKTIVTLVLASLDVVEFQEVPLMEFTNLLSRVGGTLSLWLGANFLGFYHVAFYMCRSIVEITLINRKSL